MASDLNSTSVVLASILNEHTVTILGYFLGVNGLFYTIWKAGAKLVDKMLQKRRLRNGKDEGDCSTKHQMIIDMVGSMVNDVVTQVRSIRSDFKLLADDVVKLTTVRTFEDGIRNRKDSIMINAASYIQHNKGIHDFVIHKSERFVFFVLDNYKSIWESPYSTLEERINALAIVIKEEGKALAGEEFVNYFYDNYHSRSMDRYLSDVREIFDDMVNDKTNRFVGTSMDFLQRFVSDLVKCYISWSRKEITDEFNTRISKEDCNATN